MVDVQGMQEMQEALERVRFKVCQYMLSRTADHRVFPRLLPACISIWKELQELYICIC
jgi:hypothetical protein